MATEKLQGLPPLRQGFIFADDFVGNALANSWSTAGSAAPTLTAAKHGGAATAAGGSTDNADSYALQTSRPIVPAAGLVVEGVCGFKLTEAVAAGAGMIFGIIDAIAADTLVDDGASPGILATVDFAGAYKRDGESTYRVALQEGGVGISDKLTQSTAGGGGFEEIRFQLRMPTLAECTLTVEFARGLSTALQLGRESGGSVRDPGISITRAMTAASPMGLVFGCKSGSAAAYTLEVDYIAVSCSR